MTTTTEAARCAACRPTPYKAPTETRTYAVIFRYADGHTTRLLVDGHDMGDAMSFYMRGAEAVSAVEIPGSARPLGRRSA